MSITITPSNCINYTSKNIFLGIYLLLLAYANPIYAQVTGLDLDFGKNGLVFENLSRMEEPRSILITPQNKILIMVDLIEDNPFNHKYGLIQLNQDGTRDKNFGNDGLVVSNFKSGYWHIYGRLAYANDKIILAYSASNSPILNIDKYHPNGQLDSAFGDSGHVQLKFEDAEQVSCNSLVIDYQDRIIMGGELYNGSNYNSIIIACNSDGSKDNQFADRGILKSYDETIRKTVSLKKLNANKLYSLMACTNNGYYDLRFSKFNLDGTIDHKFGKNGEIQIHISGNNDIVQDNLIINGDHIYFAGFSALSQNFIAKYKLNGTPEKEFGELGIVRLEHGFDDSFFSKNEMNFHNDNIILCGNNEFEKKSRIYIYNCMPDGYMTNYTIGDGIQYLTHNSNNLEFFESCMDMNNRLIIVGLSKESKTSEKDIFVAAYNTKN